MGDSQHINEVKNLQNPNASIRPVSETTHYVWIQYVKCEWAHQQGLIGRVTGRVTN